MSNDSKKKLSPSALQTILTAPQILTLRYTHTLYTPYFESFLQLVFTPWLLPEHGHELPARKNPRHSCQRNAQSTWSSSPLLSAYHLPPPATLRSYLSLLLITLVGLRTSYHPSLRLPLALYPGPTYHSWKFASQIRKRSKTFYPLLLSVNTLRFTPYLRPVLPQLLYLSN